MPKEVLDMFSPQSVAKGTAIALTLGAIAAPAASAGPIQDQLVMQLRHTPAVQPATSTTDGFDWGDAGIGAAGGVVVSILGVGGASALSQRRTRRTVTSAIATG